MSFYSTLLEHMGFGVYSNSTDEFTRPIRVINYKLFDYEVSKEHKSHVTACNNEYELYKTTPEIQIVIGKGAELFANGLWRVKDYKTGEIIKNHPLYQVLESPNPIQNRNEFLKDLYSNRALYGNNFSYLNYAFAGVSELPSSIVNLRPKNTVIKTTGKITKQTKINGIIDEYQTVIQHKVVDKFTPDEIVHLKSVNPDNPVLGLSPLEALHMPVSNIRAGRGYVNADYVKKGAHGVLTGKNRGDAGGAIPYTEADRLALEKQMGEKTHGSFDGQNALVISESEVDWIPISSAIGEHQIHEEIDMSFKRIIDIFGMNAACFSFLTQSTFSNQSNGEKQAYQNHIIPFAESVAYAFTDRMKLISQGVYVELDYSHVSVLQEDEREKANTTKTKADTVKTLVDSGVEIGEARRLAGLE